MSRCDALSKTIDVSVTFQLKCHLLEKLTGAKLEIPEVSQSAEGQRHKLEVVLNAATNALGLTRWSPQKWSVEAIHSKSLVASLYLLVALARQFRAPLRLPENVNVETVVVKVFVDFVHFITRKGCILKILHL